MQRRNFLKILGLSAGTASLAGTALSYNETESELDFGWNGPDPQEQDIRLKGTSKNL